VLTGTELASGDKVIDARLEAATVTLRLLLDCSVPDLAVMVTVPDVAPVAIPEELMLATLESEDVHCAELVTSFELPSE
jgi:hypothetical protein